VVEEQPLQDAVIADHCGVPDTAVEAVPDPPAFTARNRTWYATPLVRPVMESGLAVEVGVRVVHVVPLSVEYS
jgi:hypothetical protein